MKYDVWATYHASKYLGEVEAENEEEAEEKVWADDDKYDTYISLCHQCSHLEVGDVDKLEFEKKD